MTEHQSIPHKKEPVRGRRRRDGKLLPIASVDLRQSISDRIVGLMSEAINCGSLVPGQRLIEASIAENYGVSRGPVREAFKTLASVGLLQIEKNRGAFVANPSREEFEELIILRSSIEGTVARLVSVRIGPADAAALEGRILKMKLAADAHNSFAIREADWRFHEAVCEMAGSQSLLETWRGMRDKIRLHLHLNPHFAANPARVVENHRRYMAALQTGNPVRAERTIRGMILSNGYRLLDRPVPEALVDLIDKDD